MLPELYQTVLTNFGYTKYIGESLDIAQANAESSGFECYILKGGLLKATYSPISGWKMC